MMNSKNSAGTITLTIETGPSAGLKLSRSEPFQIGRHSDCAVCIQDNVVSRFHAELYVDEGQWWIKDLNSANGVIVNDKRIVRAPLAGSDRFELGNGGPQFSYSITSPAADTSTGEPSAPHPSKKITPSVVSEAERTDLDHYKKYYFSDTDGHAAGEHTMMVRQAFAEVQKEQRLTYGIIIGFVVALLIITASVALYNHGQVVRQRKLAAEVFYALRTLEIDLMKLRLETEQSRSLEAKFQMGVVKTQKEKLEQSYERYVESLGVYSKGLSEKEKLILRMARRFGECEINMPKGFAAEVSDFIENWQSTKRLSNVIKKAKRRGYIDGIVRALEEQELPPQFFYLAVQESNLNSRAVGPPTRFGIAKGMWQFIPATAEKYGLQTGPLKGEAVVDLKDERHHIQKSTQAAARYLRDIYTTDAQASGLLVMAAYNWGEDRVIDLIRTMPANPRDRNFWQLISKYRHKLPDQTYDYVFSIFSAAVIGENPRLFGFDFNNPLAGANITD